jgi:hypothetical protein
MDQSPALPAIFDRAFRDAVRQDCRAAYQLSADRIFSPADGWGSMLFGVAIYFNLDARFRARFLEAAALRYVTGAKGPELRAADQRVRWNKTGSGIGAPSAMERPSGVMLELAEQNSAAQMSMFETRGFINWVIAHAGNATDGLLSIHIAAPQLARNGLVVGWLESIAIFDARHPDHDLPDVAAPGLPESVELLELELAFKADAPSIEEADQGRRVDADVE